MSEPLIRDARTSPADLRIAAAELAKLDQWCGIESTLRHFLNRWFNPERCYRILDINAGGASVARMAVDYARARSIAVRVDAVEDCPGLAALAREQCQGYSEIAVHDLDITTEQPLTSYDLVHCCLAHRTLSEEAAARLLGRCRDLATRWVLVTGIDRHVVTSALMRLMIAAGAVHPVSRHDALLAARESFSFRQMQELAKVAGWQGFGAGRYWWCCQALWLEKLDLGDIPLVAEMPSLA